MLNIFVCKRIDAPGLQHVHVLNYYYAQPDFKAERAGDKAIKLLNKKFFNLVESPEEADYLLAPHDYFAIDDRQYWDEISSFAKLQNKKVIVFAYGDRDDRVMVDNSIVFRTSQYKDAQLAGLNSIEVVMPAIADDLISNTFEIINKKNIPIVGFCGWADFPLEYNWFKKNAVNFMELFKKDYLKRGIVLRKKIISLLSKSSLISKNFIIRNSYSGNEKTRTGNFSELREEYVNNIIGSDFSLAIKGAGNFSIRFYEILSLGRIPLFIDTKCILPIDDVVNYNEFVLKVDVSQIEYLPRIVSEFYKGTSESDFALMQQKARDAFENYLRIDKYFDYVFLNPDSNILNKNAD